MALKFVATAKDRATLSQYYKFIRIRDILGTPMVITSISLFIYGIGTATSLAMTYIEGARRDKNWDFYRVTGIVLCFFWPLLVPLLVVATAFSALGSQKRRQNMLPFGREKTLS
ncbi:hypothetical protein [Agrobacterium tumefaciens]|uniref:hypothetical protein n=1 Tax=Agrobacterium tumefaciens TaxID=358 RepID=UPI001F454539|nr:hypothetical protein [Agrobacterium tumefaciens]WCJ61909.1 hypothetical protein G6M15_10770 [Agrobacterium tumefaciens]